MAQRSQLSASLVQKGHAAPVEPSVAAADPQPELGHEQVPEPAREPMLEPSHEPARNTPRFSVPPDKAVPRAARSSPPVQPAPVAEPLKPVPKHAIERQTLGVRVPLDVAAGLKAMTYFTGEAQQDIITRFLLDGLDRWRSDWRSHIPER
jgi:hypothetical protein